tara:strand:- start:1475 stop:2455 length:981 start_codon:yes stop_codon:yes gene_type:complete
MNIGKLDRLVEIKQATFIQNNYGERQRTSTTIASVFARFEFEKGKAGYDADIFVGTSPAKMTIRYTTNIDLSPNYFIRYNSKDWFIKSIQEIGRKEGLTLFVEEQTSSLATDIFSLSDVTGLVLHYKFNTALAATTDGIQWTDQSDQSNNGTQTVDAAEPTIENGYLTFDGTSDFVNFASTVSLNETTIFMAVYIAAYTTETTLGNVGNSNMFGRFSNSTTFRFRRGGAGGGENVDISHTALPVDTLMLITLQQTGDTLFMRRDASQIGSGSILASNTFETNNYGTQNGGGLFGGRLYEVAIYNNSISDANRTLVEADIMDRLSIS